jgi:hypothetical protein
MVFARWMTTMRPRVQAWIVGSQKIPQSCCQRTIASAWSMAALAAPLEMERTAL